MIYFWELICSYADDKQKLNKPTVVNKQQDNIFGFEWKVRGKLESEVGVFLVLIC